MKKILLLMVCLVLILFSGCNKLKIEEDDKEDGATHINITADLPYAVDISFIGCKAELEYDEGMTVTAEPSGPVDGYRWFLDDDELEGETGATVEIGEDIEPGKHRLDLFVTKGDKIIGSGSVIFYKKDNRDISLEGTWCYTEAYIRSSVNDEIYEWFYPGEEGEETGKLYIQFRKNVFRSFEQTPAKVRLFEEIPYHLEGNKIIFADITETLGKEVIYSIEGLNGSFEGTTVIEESDLYQEIYILVKAVKANDSDVVGAVKEEWP